MSALLSGILFEHLMQFATVAVSCAAVYFSISAMVRDRRTTQKRSRVRQLREGGSGRSDGQRLDPSR